MWIVRFSKIRFVCKALVTESIQVLQLVDSILNDESCHSFTTSLGPYCLHLQIAPFANKEQWLDDVNFLTDSLPVKQVLCNHCIIKYAKIICHTENFSNFVLRCTTIDVIALLNLLLSLVPQFGLYTDSRAEVYTIAAMCHSKAESVLARPIGFYQ